MTQPAEQRHGPTAPGTVVLNLGPGIGALIIEVTAEHDGTEIEISRSDDAGSHRTHSQVRERSAPGGSRFAAVYPDLPAGDYSVWQDASRIAGAVTVTGGAVARFDWPEGL